MNMPNPKVTILLVEDDPCTRDLIKLAMRRLDIQVVTTRDGVEALELLRQQRPQLILLDILLPYLSGLDVLRQIKQDDLLKQVPVIMISALGYREVVQQTLEAGASGFILKPFRVDELVNRVKIALEQTQGLSERVIES